MLVVLLLSPTPFLGDFSETCNLKRLFNIFNLAIAAASSYRIVSRIRGLRLELVVARDQHQAYINTIMSMLKRIFVQMGFANFTTKCKRGGIRLRCKDG